MNEPRILVDTAAWLAFFHRRDQHHDNALAFFRHLRGRRTELVVTNLILAELHVHLLRVLGPRGAADYLERVKSDPVVTEIYANEDLQKIALGDWIRRFQDQSFTLTDAVSFAVMRARRIREAFSFDRHFEVAGFRRVPALGR